MKNEKQWRELHAQGKTAREAAAAMGKGVHRAWQVARTLRIQWSSTLGRPRKSQPKPQWTLAQTACIETLTRWVGGSHHLPRVREFGTGVCINYTGDLSTFDFDRLTALVLYAHRDAVRIEIASSGPRRVKIIAHKRIHKGSPDEQRRIWEYHPTLADLESRIQLLK